MAKYIPDYTAVAKRPNKFCHGFGVFQYDLQFFKTNPQFFLQQKYGDLETLANAWYRYSYAEWDDIQAPRDAQPLDLDQLGGLTGG